jgi:hypothetical protein
MEELGPQSVTNNKDGRGAGLGVFVSKGTTEKRRDT